jgi:hypothetical protein
LAGLLIVVPAVDGVVVVVVVGEPGIEQVLQFTVAPRPEPELRVLLGKEGVVAGAAASPWVCVSGLLARITRRPVPSVGMKSRLRFKPSPSSWIQAAPILVQ